MSDTFDFTPERRTYDKVRTQYEDNACVFVANNSNGIVGYVTFGADVQRLKSAMEHLHLPEHTARYFNEGTVLWLMDASEERARALSDLCRCPIFFVYEKS